jgi:predicted PhzF superfamily epimerase YddE/YHI9
LRAVLFQVVTFANHPFHGNPAFVLRNAKGIAAGTLMSLCDHLHTEIIAVIDEDDGDAPQLRFFTPEGPHAGAGHATMAAAHVALKLPGPLAREKISFHVPNGERRDAEIIDGRIAVRFPRLAASPVDRVAQMTAALRAPPLETLVSSFGYIGFYRDAATIAELKPDMALVSGFDRPAVIATAPGDGASDIVIRVFAPSVGLPEDPVCGTAHRIIAPLWSQWMQKDTIHSRHLSPRGGDLWCRPDGEDVVIAGDTSLVIAGTEELPDA